MQQQVLTISSWLSLVAACRNLKDLEEANRLLVDTDLNAETVADLKATAREVVVGEGGRRVRAQALLAMKVRHVNAVLATQVN